MITKPPITKAICAMPAGQAQKAPASMKSTRQPYFRWLGPTAVAAPTNGVFRLVSLNLKSTETEENVTNSVVTVDRNSVDNNTSITKLYPCMEMSFDSNLPPLPEIDVYRRFNETMSNYLPYMTVEGFEERILKGVVGQCLLYAMAGLSERLSPSDKAKSAEEQSLAEKYTEAAKRLIIPHLACPRIEVAYTLLLIAYNEFADDRDSGVWAWSGMAIRMCYDLGLHKPESSKIYDDSFCQRVFWAVVCLDRIISVGTGRQTTIPDSDVDREPELNLISQTELDDPFPYVCRVFILIGRVSNYVNSNSSQWTDQPSEECLKKLSEFSEQTSNFYSALPPDLYFDVQNFQLYTKKKHSQVFLLLHIWYQALLLLVHQPSLVYPNSNRRAQHELSLRQAELNGKSAISIGDMISFAELIEPNSFLANPFLSQPIYMAACASLTLCDTIPRTLSSHSVYTLRKTYSTCRQVLGRMQRIWKGISVHTKTLDSLAASESDVDLSTTSEGFIITEDIGVIRRASLDESTRKWLMDGIYQGNVDDIYGLFISGTTDYDPQELYAKTDNSPESHTSGSQKTPLLLENCDKHESEVKIKPLTPPDENNFEFYNDLNDDNADSFHSLLMRNMEMSEYLKL